MEQVAVEDIAQARESLQRIVDAMARGELAGGGLLTRHLEGALATLEALCKVAEDSAE